MLARPLEQRAAGVGWRERWDTQKIHKGGFYHDGRFATLREVVDHYDSFFKTGLTDGEKSDLIEYLKSL